MIKKTYLMSMLLAICSLHANAEVFTEEILSATKGSQVKSASSLTTDTYYIISGIDQSDREYYLYDNGSQVKASASFPEKSSETRAHIWTLKSSGNQWIITNVATNNAMNLGGSNGSAINTSATQQTNAIHFGSNGYITILNSNGQAIDMTANGANPTTWTGTTTPNGSRRLKIYEVEDAKTETIRSLSLVPAPKSAVVGDGEFVLNQGFTVGVERFKDTEVQNQVVADVARFISTINQATGLSCKGGASGSDITIAENESIASEGYILDITKDGVNIDASSARGVFYALQSLMRLMPENVILGKPGQDETNYSLPVARIEDEPRFPYRGFMLDVSRHFFTIEQVKKMIDLMAIYKMNVFHWHLTDDQGWRAEIKQYPLLTTTGAQRRSSYDTPITQVIENGQVYWTGSGAQTNREYGPFYYTQEEMRDVVRYAAERHIDVLPEVDMPGHFVAALAAYPEYCCHPDWAPQVWITGGVSQDVLNVANPEAVQFAKNIITELCDIFPYPYFHIGGDECPTTQWESNTLCQQKLAQMGKTSYRALQTEFIREIGEHLGSLGKKMFCWNESITDNGADLDLMKKSGATIMCWNPCQGGARKAAELGLNAIITEWGSGCYYINRRQSNDYGEPTGAGYGGDNVQGTYNYVPVPTDISTDLSKYYIGVQATFWTEHVSSNEYLEYASLPRFMCIAEAGWTPQEQKDWNSFVRRMTVDTKMLDLGGYVYARHWMKDYVPRQAPSSAMSDGSIVTFTNQSADRGRCLRDDNGTLNGQGSECTQWTLESAGAEGKFYIRSNVSGKYLYAENGNKGTMVQLSTDKTVWTFDTSTMAGYVAICYNSTSGKAVNNNVSNATKTRLFDHGSGNGASFWAIEKFEEKNLKEGETGVLTYSYYYRGLTVGTKEFNLVAGSSYPSHVDHVPSGYAPKSTSAFSGKITLKNETKEIEVEKVPETGRYYRFYNTAYNKNLSTDATTLQTYSLADVKASTIFYYDNSSLLSYDRGMFLSGAELSEDHEQAAVVSLLPSAAKNLDMCNIISNDTAYLKVYSKPETPNTVGKRSSATIGKSYDFHPRFILSLPVEVDASGWASFSACAPVTVPQGCTAYIAESYDATTANLTLKAITSGSTISANTGFLLQATPNTTVDLQITEKGISYEENLLLPSVATTAVSSDTQAYTLTCANGVVSYLKTGNDNSVIPAHSSWLKLDITDAPKSISITIPGVETSIQSTGSTKPNTSSIYNLKGQSLKTPENGVNIIDGKKVLK